MGIYEGLRKIAERTEQRTPVLIGFVGKINRGEFAVVGEVGYIGDLAERTKEKSLTGMMVNIYD